MIEVLGRLNSLAVGIDDNSIELYVCEKCGNTMAIEDYKNNYKVCWECGHHARLSAKERILYTVDKGTFIEMDGDVVGNDPLNFPDYEQKQQAIRIKTHVNEAVVCGVGEIEGNKSVICVMDSTYIMGSMGMAVGEKITRAIEKATKEKMPIVIFTVSGGARMQEGIISLMQMAKTSGAIARHNEAGQLFISVITDPTAGGVTASFASLGDVIIAEPRATICFAGRRVIEQTIKQTLPAGFQTSEFMLEKGFIDMIVERQKIKSTLGKLLKIHNYKEER